ncbi:DUF932 domain-containing protein [Rosenbergiella collisarenosi]|uniref:DUF932 domain-containing protein n=1 Tax=Rosenbergiella collisarenosi TaxID=1544695 RepID=UPI001F4E1255|nr:DUF932 domain-containing protein [Rosenbergiella collisarenosi]
MYYSKQLVSRFSNKNSIRSDIPLTDEQIMRVAPSIFSEGKHESRSDRYSYIPTNIIYEKLKEEGFDAFMVCQTRTRKEGMMEHTKHMMRLRHRSHQVGAEANEIILINSHNGTSSYQMKAGMYRFVCSNGLVVGEDIADIRVSHSGNVKDRVIEGVYEVVDSFDKVTEHKEMMKSLQLSTDVQHAFAEAALSLRYDIDKQPAPITANQLLLPRRREDKENDLWTTFNRVQENLIRGGLSGRNKAGKRTTTRSVTGLDQDVKLNRALWILGQQLKNALK